MNDQEQYVDIQPEDPDWITQQLERRPGNARVLVRLSEDEFDLEGHVAGTTLRLQAYEDEDDTEGHAIAVRFPTRGEADEFRRRLMLTGALTGTLVLGAAGGFGLATIAGEGPAGGSSISEPAPEGAIPAGGGTMVDANSPARGNAPVPE